MFSHQVKAISNLVKIKERNKFIVKIIKRARKNKKRKILVLSAQREHLNVLQQLTDKLKNGTTSQYVGGMKEKELDEAAKAPGQATDTHL